MVTDLRRAWPASSKKVTVPPSGSADRGAIAPAGSRTGPSRRRGRAPRAVDLLRRQPLRGKPHQTDRVYDGWAGRNLDRGGTARAPRRSDAAASYRRGFASAAVEGLSTAGTVCLANSSSTSRRAASLAGFFILSQYGDRPDI